MIKTLFIKYTNQVKNALGYKENKSSENILKSNINKTKIQDMIIYEYSITLLEATKKNYENLYLTERELEKNMIPHTEKHKEKLLVMNKITEDITKLQEEINILKNIRIITHQQLLKEMRLKYIIEWKA